MKLVYDNLVIVSLSDSMGGAEQFLQLIATETESPFIFLKKSRENSLQEIDSGKATYVSQSSLFLGFLFLPFILYPYRKKFTIMSSHPYLNAVIGFLKRIGYLKGWIIARESTSIFARYRGLKKWSYQIAYRLGYPGIDRLICQTNDMLQQLMQHNPFLAAEKVKMIPNPIDIQKAVDRSNGEKPIVPASYICSAGRLIPIKGFDVLILAFSLLVARYQDLKLVILGSGPEKERLLTLIKQLQLEESVLLLGHQKNPYPYFKHANICVVPSIMEGFPNVLLQMMAVNASVVSTLCAGGIADIPQIVKVKVNDAQDLYNGLHQALKQVAVESKWVLEHFLEKRSPKNYVKQLFKV